MNRQNAPKVKDAPLAPVNKWPELGEQMPLHLANEQQKAEQERRRLSVELPGAPSSTAEQKAALYAALKRRARGGPQS